MNILHKLQNLPIRTRKIILWSVVIVIGLSILSWWWVRMKEKFGGFRSEEFIKELKLPELGEKLKAPPMPETEEEMKELEKLIEEVQQQQQ